MVLVFCASDKGGAGRSVTGVNIAYRLSVSGHNVAYVDFDFGSPLAGALFEVGKAECGVADGGVHSYLLGERGTAARIDIGAASDRRGLRRAGPRAGRLVLVPGDEGGAEFIIRDSAVVRRCAELLVALDREFGVVFVDLSAGRCAALEIALQAAALPPLRRSAVRWLVFHRWSRQHVLAAAGLVHGRHGLLQTGAECGHDPDELLGSIRYVRTAVSGGAEHQAGRHPAQAAWLQEQDAALRRLATANRLGASAVLGAVPWEPVLHWREQIILDADVHARIANDETAHAYTELARRLVDSPTWERFW
ncbi:SCO2523 family variant P-loop protein [Nocardia vinacea]|uniref:SCO2523 family variant P-loop protein n=1 Tax=Nocardia vinacea TaxID=96468 RepID=UPI0033C39397